jgi:hypothetical protein
VSRDFRHCPFKGWWLDGRFFTGRGDWLGLVEGRVVFVKGVGGREDILLKRREVAAGCLSWRGRARWIVVLEGR